MAERLAPTIVTRLGEPCVNELKSSVENGLLKQEDCLKLAKKISKKVHKDVSDSIKRGGYNASTVITLLTSWLKHKPKEVWILTLLNILRSSNIKHDALHSLAQRLDEIYTKIRKPHDKEGMGVNGHGNNNDMEIDGNLERNEFQASKRLVRQAIEKEKEARRKNEEARKTKEEAQKTKEEARKAKEEAQRIKDEAEKSQEAFLMRMKNMQISSKKKVNGVHNICFSCSSCFSCRWQVLFSELVLALTQRCMPSTRATTTTRTSWARGSSDVCSRRA